MKIYMTLGALAFCATAFGQLSTGFEASEGYAGSAGGTIITGVNGWYVPVAGSADGRVHTYAGNTLLFPVNPSGGSQFLGQVCDHVNYPAVGFSRAQHAVPLGAGKWSLTYDFCANDTAAPPANDNIGSVSLQPSATSNYFQTLMHWVDFNVPTTYFLDYGVDTSGLGISGGVFTVFYSPGPEWTNLPVNNWFRSNTVWDFTTNQIISVSIQNLTTGGAKTTVSPSGWYLSGGANNVLAQTMPTDIRFFCGGALDGNITGFDNLDLKRPTTVLAPTSFVVGLGNQISGTTASLAADDADPLKLCKGFVPNVAAPRMRMDATYLSPVLTATSLQLDMKARMTTGGAFKIRGFLADTSGSGTFTYGVANQVIADTTIALAFANYSSGAVATGNHIDTDADATTDGTIVARTEIQQTGFSAVAVPCSEWELMTVTVTP